MNTTARRTLAANVIVRNLQLSVLCSLAILAACQYPTDRMFFGYPSIDFFPLFTPDGKKILYYHSHYRRINRDGTAEYVPDSTGIWMVEADGRNPHLILQRTSLSFDVSPDAMWLVYTDRSQQLRKIKIDADTVDGGSDQPLTSEGRNGSPRWSREGKWIAYSFARPNQDENSIIYKMCPDGSGKTSIGRYWENSRAWQGHPDWSLDGRYVLFEHSPGQFAWRGIVVLDTSGYPFTFLEGDGNPNSAPSYSPDGSKILFQSDTYSGTVVKVMDKGGTNPQSIVEGSSPSWSPDGQKIVFLRRLVDEGNFKDNSTVWVVNRDGTGLKQVTFGPR